MLCSTCHFPSSPTGRYCSFCGARQVAAAQNGPDLWLDAAKDRDLFERLSALTPDLMYVLDVVEERYRFVNDAVLRFLGCTREELMGPRGVQFVIESMHPEDRRQTMARHEELVRAYGERADPADDRRAERFDYRLRDSQGRWRWLQSWGAIFSRTEGGRVRQIWGIARDVSDQRDAEESVRLNEGRLRLALDMARMLSWDWMVGSNEVAFSADYGEFFGLPPTGLVVKNDETILEPVHPADREGVLRAFQSLLEGGGEFRVEFRGLPRDGEHAWYLARGRIRETLDGKPSRMIGITQDITLIKKAEGVLRRSNEELENRVRLRTAELQKANSLLQATMDSTLDGLLVVDLQRQVSGANRKFYEMWQIPDLADRRDHDVLLAAAKDQLLAPEAFVGKVRELFADPERECLDTLEFKDGRTFERLSGPHVLNGEVVGRVCSFRDVTEQKRTEESLAKQHRKLSTLSLTLSGEPSDIFERTVRILGDMFQVRVVCLSEVVGQELYFRAVYVDGNVSRDAGSCPLNITPCVTVETDKAIRVFDRVQERFPLASFLKDHNAVAYCGFPALSADGRVVAVTCLLDDKPREFTPEDQEILQLFGQRIAAEVERQRHLIEREKAEEQVLEFRVELAHVARLGTMGEMASGLAHELNQPLAALAMYASAAQQLASRFDSDELQKLLARIGEQSLRAGEIVRRMRSFVSRSPFRRAPTDVHPLIRDVLSILESDLRHNGVELRLDFDERLPPAFVDGIQIQQVLVNLIRNAIEALSRNDSGARLLSISTDSAETGVRVSVADTGCGLAPEIAANLFQPFQTTKPAGLGLGLAICRTLVEAHEGRIDCRPNPEGGTVFFFVLPIAQEQAVE